MVFITTELVFILNRSGSMAGLEADTISGFNSMIARQKEKYGWEFLFLSANIDAAKEAARFGIDADRAVNYKCDKEGTALNYEVISVVVCSVRSTQALSADWKRRIDEDVEKRRR